MRTEICKCQGCGYEYEMPDMRDFPKDALGTMDIASWVYCTPDCLTHDTWPDEYREMGMLGRVLRPFFRWRERRKYSQFLRELTT